jgi:hypothetical protein
LAPGADDHGAESAADATRARSCLIETPDWALRVAVASGEVRRGWLPNRLPACVPGFRSMCCLVGPRRGVARKRDERPPQVWYKACPPRLPEYPEMILECADGSDDRG